MNVFKLKTKLIAISVFTTACSSQRAIQSHYVEQEIEGDVIVSSSNGTRDFPNWALEEPRTIENNVLYVTGSVDIASNQSPARGLDAAKLVALANLSSEIEQRLRNQMQYAAEGFDVGSETLEQIITNESKLERLQGAYVAKQWYAMVRTSTEFGKMGRYKCFARVGIPMSILRAQMNRSLSGPSGSNLSPAFKEKVKKSWDEFFGSESSSGKFEAQVSQETAPAPKKFRTRESEPLPAGVATELPKKKLVDILEEKPSTTETQPTTERKFDTSQLAREPELDRSIFPVKPLVF